jgi:hypothetical protein
LVNVAVTPDGRALVEKVIGVVIAPVFRVAVRDDEPLVPP